MAGTININVRAGGYPVWIEVTIDGRTVQVDHRNLLELEHAINVARRDVLLALPRNLWHEVDPALAGK